MTTMSIYNHIYNPFSDVCFQQSNTSYHKMGEMGEFPHGCRVTVPSCSIWTQVFEENFYLVEFMPIKTKAIQKSKQGLTR